MLTMASWRSLKRAAVLCRKPDDARSSPEGDRRVADPTRKAFRSRGTAPRGAHPRRDVPDRNDAPLRAGADEGFSCRPHLDPRGALCAASPGAHPATDRRAAEGDDTDTRDAHHRVVGAARSFLAQPGGAEHFQEAPALLEGGIARL